MSQLQTVSDNLETHSWRILTMWQFEKLLYFSCPDRVCQRDQCETLSLTHFWFWKTQRDPRHLWTFGHLLRVMRKHDLTNKKTMTKTKTKTMAFREQLQMTILEKLWNSWHLWKLRTSKHYNYSHLTIKSDAGQHSQLLWCFVHQVQCRASPSRLAQRSFQAQRQMLSWKFATLQAIVAKHEH